jgi:steroid delta-isomerase-like uncharacterized protein
MPHENAGIVRALYDAFNDRDFDRGLELLADGFQLLNVATGEVFHGREGNLRFLNGWVSAFSDARAEVERIVADDACAVVEFHGRGTHDGAFPTPMGTIPPSGRTIDFRLVDVWEISGGKLVRGRTYFDSATILRQIGALAWSPPAAAVDIAGVSLPQPVPVQHA